jgi:hypothetical protein
VGIVGDAQINLARERFPYIRVIALAVLALAWMASMRFSFTYVVPDTPYGPVADDGDSLGYERVRAVGLAYGSVVFQTIHRTSDVGWQVSRQKIHFLLWAFRDNVEGFWGATTTGVSLLIPLLAVAAATIPYWRTCRRTGCCGGGEGG